MDGSDFVKDGWQAGLWLVTPTSVAGSGVTLSGQTVSFTDATSVSVNGCFTSKYRNYLVLFEGQRGSGSEGQIDFRFRAAGNNTTALSYAFQGVSQTSTSAPIAQSGASVVAGYFSNVGATAVGSAHARMNVFNPERTAYTGFTVETGFEWISNTFFYRAVSGLFRATTSFDGFSLIPATGNLSGTLKIYGYN
jgi:hypothetical protein